MAMGLHSGYSDVSLGHEAAVRVVDSIVNGESIRIVPVDSELEEAAWRIFRAAECETLSFAESTSFALMRRQRLRSAFTFDEHFRTFGFEVLPAGQ